MKQGRHLQLPERPSELRQLWAAAAPLAPEQVPAWLPPEDAAWYRIACVAPVGGLTPQEIGEAEALKFVVEERDGEVRVFMPHPPMDPVFSISIYAGDEPWAVSPVARVRCPVLTAEDVTDVPAAFVADPFIFRDGDRWWMFFEIWHWRKKQGEIGLASAADPRGPWRYERVVLAEDFHLSYPCVIESGGERYMVPESHDAGGVRLYRAKSFPHEWEYAATLLEGPYLADASPFEHSGRWWMFVDSSADKAHHTLRLFTAEKLAGPWAEHPRSPVVEGDNRIARPAGCPKFSNGRLVRFAQVCAPEYGTAVRAFEITELTTTTYAEHELSALPILGPSGTGWNADGMHHIDAHPLPDGTWIAAVDGWHQPG
jgi:hypothetical protein